MSPITLSSFASACVARRTVASMVGESVCGGIARMHAGELDVLQHSADHGGLAVADAVDVELDRVLEEFVDQDRFARHHVERLTNDRFEFIFAVNDKHPAATEHEGGTQQHR